MIVPGISDLRLFTLDGARGQLLATYYPAAEGSPHRGDVLVAPPFAEEMNRCRSMVALQARALSRVGVGTLIVDPFGTGDSGGDFCDGDWQGWQDDLRLGINWLRLHGGGCRAIWGIRLGAIMAAQLAEIDGHIDRLLLWQPVLSGRAYFTQFLRIRIAADLERPDGVKSTDQLRQSSAAGHAIEISGYRIGPTLAAALDVLEMPAPERMKSLRVDWFDVAADMAAPPSRASSKMIEQFRAAGIQMELRAVVGPPFWQVHERELAPELIASTQQVASAWDVHPAETNTADTAVWCSDGFGEVPCLIPCGADQLAGVIHSRGSSTASSRGVVVVVAGGPQYRAGAHRQFVSMARKFAAAGHAVLRFDLRGMGDSSGDYVGFEHSARDIRAAVDVLLLKNPDVREVVLIGECESATGILFYAWRDARVTGAVLVNPWVRTESGQAQVILKHYYLDRLRSATFWRDFLGGRISVARSLRSLLEVVSTVLRKQPTANQVRPVASDEDFSGLPLPERTAEGLRRFPGRVMFLMSGRDYIAREFDEVTASSSAWKSLLKSPRIHRTDLMEADHTFSREEWKQSASDSILGWLGRW